MKHSLLTLTLLLTCGAFADHYWQGLGSTSDWTNSDNWVNALDNGNTVFGGAQIGALPADGSFPTFSSLYTSGQRLWVENGSKPGVTFDVSEGASEDAGWTTTHTGDPTWTIGTGNKGDLTIKGGKYTLPKGLYVGTGSGESSLTISGGEVSVTTQIQIARDGNNTSTLTITNGLLRTSDLFQIGLNGTAYLNMNGGTLESGNAFRFATDNANAKAYAVVSNGTINTSGNFVIANKGEARFEMYGGQVNVNNNKEIYVGGPDANTAHGVIVMEGGAISNKQSYTSIGRTGKGELYLKGGEFFGSNVISIGRYGTATGIVEVTGGLMRSNNRIIAGEDGEGTLIVKGGVVEAGDQVMASWGSGGHGKIIVEDGRLGRSDRLIQIGLKSAGEFEMTGGEALCIGFRLGTDAATAVGTATISGGKITATEANGNTRGVYVGNTGIGRMYFNGGVIETKDVGVGNGSGTLVLNGGTFKARSNNGAYIQNSAKLAVKLGANGVTFDTAGYDIATAATLANDEDDEALTGNGPIAKKGLGQLEISSDLDLNRTFKFTIDDGVGPIALTGTGNTLAENAKITVEINPVSADVNTPYTVLTGLGSGVTIDDIELTGPDTFTYAGEIDEGALKVTLTGAATTATTAKFVDGKWCYYDAEGNLIVNGEPIEITSFVFTGAEPEGELAKVAAMGRNVIFEAKKNGEATVTNTITLDADVTLARLTVNTDEGCAVKIVGNGQTLSATLVSNNGKVVLGGTLTVEGLFQDGVYELEEGAKVTLAKNISIAAKVIGLGELIVDGVTLTLEKSQYMGYFGGTLTLTNGATLNNMTLLHENEADAGSLYSFGKEATAKLRLAGGTVFEGDRYCNNEKIQNIEVVAGTDNVINNDHGLNWDINGDFTGSGNLSLRSAGRGIRFIGTDLSNFTGTITLTNGTAYVFNRGIMGGTVVAEAGAVVTADSKAIAVDAATLTLKNTNADTSYQVGSTATLNVASAVTVKGVTFASGSSIELIDEGALTDVKTKYVLLTSVDPISVSRTTPMLVQEENPRGTWKLVVEEIKEQVDDGEGNVSEQTTGYQLCAQFRPKGFVVIIQ